MSNIKPLIGITMGDPSGIGMEVILKTLQHDFVYESCTPVLYALPNVFASTKRACGLEKPVYKLIRNIDEAKEGHLNLIATGGGNTEFTIGQPTKEGGKEALSAIDKMLEDVISGKLQAVVTAPVDKNSIDKNKPFTGHTGYIAGALGVKNHLMILYTEDLKVGLVTEHLPLADVAGKITTDLIVSKAEVFIHSLIHDFGVNKPKIAVLGLNPHAGDGGTIGKEESAIIAPAIKKLADKGNAIVFGPYPADGLWGTGNVKNFDGVLAMYHDQGLAPFKALAFDEGVNFTAGLPIIRTSPDHGTAYDIAAQYKANSYSFSEALFSAIKLLANRKEFSELKTNFLPFIEHKRERFRLETRDLQNM